MIPPKWALFPPQIPQALLAQDQERRAHGPRPTAVLEMLQQHLLEHTAAGPSGLLFPGDRTDHMSVRYLMDRYRPARETAGGDVVWSGMTRCGLVVGGLEPRSFPPLTRNRRPT